MAFYKLDYEIKEITQKSRAIFKWFWVLRNEDGKAFATAGKYMANKAALISSIRTIRELLEYGKSVETDHMGPLPGQAEHQYLMTRNKVKVAVIRCPYSIFKKAFLEASVPNPSGPIQ